MISFQISVTHVFQVFLFLLQFKFCRLRKKFPDWDSIICRMSGIFGEGVSPPPTHTQTQATPLTSWIILYSDLIGSVIIRYSCDGNESNDLQSFSILREVEDMLTGHFSGTCTGYHVHVKTKI